MSEKIMFNATGFLLICNILGTRGKLGKFFQHSWDLLFSARLKSE